MSQIISIIATHKIGYTCIAFDTDNQHLFTGGSEGKVTVWESITDENPEEHIVGERVNAVICRKSHFITATESTSVQLQQIQDGLPDGIATRFTAEVNHLALNKEHTKLAAGAGDFVVKVVEFPGDDTSSHETAYEGHTGPILSVALDPLDIFVSSTSCDGSLRIWRLDTPHVEAKVIPRTLSQCSDPSLALAPGRMAWDPVEGKILAVAIDREVRLLERNTWQILRFLSCSLVSQPILDISFSEDGTYLAAGTKDGWLVVWRVENRDVVSRLKHSKGDGICSLQWHPTLPMTIVFSDLAGGVGSARIVIKVQEDKKTFSADEALTAEQIAEMMDDDIDLDLAQVAADQAKSRTADNEDIDDEDDNSVDISKIKASFLGDKDESSSDSEDDKRAKRPPPPPTVMKMPEPHAPFQPGSTPIGLLRRFMLWNRVGVVSQFDTEEEQSIEVEFHDTNLHHTLFIKNTSTGYSIADLNQYVLVLASTCDPEDADDSSRLYVQLLSGASPGHSEWTSILPRGESVLCICAVGSKWVVMATNQRLLRVFTLIGGIQVGLISLPGGPVSLAGCSSVHGSRLFVVTDGAPSGSNSGSGAPQGRIIDLDTKRRVKSEGWGDAWTPVPMAKGSYLTWIGFSDAGSPFTVDSSGTVRCLSRQWGDNWWTPVLQLRSLMKQPGDHFFVVGVTEAGGGKVQAIYCKASRFPHTLPRPLVSLIDFQVPVCQPDTEQGKFEEEYLRSRTMTNLCRQVDDDFDLDSLLASTLRQEKAVLLRMFALALKMDQESQAMQVAELMPDAQTVQLANRYAGKSRRMQLAARLVDLALAKEREAVGQESESSAEEEEDSEPVMVKKLPPSRRRQQSSSEEEEEEPSPPRQTTKRGPPPASEDDSMASLPSRSRDVRKASVSEEEDDTMEDQEENTEDNLLLTDDSATTQITKRPIVSVGVSKNPFKKSTDSQNDSLISNRSSGSQVFDSLRKESFVTQHNKPPLTNQNKSMKSDTAKTSGKKQATLFGTVQAENIPPKGLKKPATKQSSLEGFEEWFEENREELEEEFPDKTAEDIYEIGRSRFQKLSGNQSSTIKAVESNPKSRGRPKKRLADDVEVDHCKRQSLSSETKSKLSSFTFT